MERYKSQVMYKLGLFSFIPHMVFRQKLIMWKALGMGAHSTDEHRDLHEIALKCTHEVTFTIKKVNQVFSCLDCKEKQS